MTAVAQVLDEFLRSSQHESHAAELEQLLHRLIVQLNAGVVPLPPRAEHAARQSELARLSELAKQAIELLVPPKGNMLLSELEPLEAATHARLGTLRELVIANITAQFVWADYQRRFESLAERWHLETAHLSSLTKRFARPAYQEIVGEPAFVPFVLRELERGVGHWGRALAAMTGQNPVPSDAAGDAQRVAEAWLRWGREHDLVDDR